MNLLSQILENEVYPAFGCTEPISVAYATAKASKIIKNINPEKMKITVNLDPGTYKNGYGVNIPNLKNEKGNLIAAALGALISKPKLKYNIFSNVPVKKINQAKKMIKENRVKINVDYTKKEIYVEAVIENRKDKSTCILNKSHFQTSLLMLNDKILSSHALKEKHLDYKEIVKNMSFNELVSLASNASEKELRYIKKGINMNLQAAKAGLELKKIGYTIKNFGAPNGNDWILKAKYLAASATDARMGGLPLTVMSSGQSGNQGVVAILTPYIAGKHNNIDEKIILKSISLAHIINSYIKSYTGELAPVCGCVISSGAGASAAIAYQKYPDDIKKIEGAVNNVLADIGGMICDGAKESCSLKVSSSVESAIKNAYLSISGISVASSNAFIETNPSNTIKNMARLSVIGMASIDSIIIETMKNKPN